MCVLEYGDDDISDECINNIEGEGGGEESLDESE
jgi:hypothetical protein